MDIKASIRTNGDLSHTSLRPGRRNATAPPRGALQAPYRPHPGGNEAQCWGLTWLVNPVLTASVCLRSLRRWGLASRRCLTSWSARAGLSYRNAPRVRAKSSPRCSTSWWTWLDGIALPAGVRTSFGSPHPRSFGSHTRLLSEYVRERKVFTVEEAVRKMTSLPANRLGLADRGILRPGMKADVVVFDPATVKDMATYENPPIFARNRLGSGQWHAVVPLASPQTRSLQSCADPLQTAPHRWIVPHGACFLVIWWDGRLLRPSTASSISPGRMLGRRIPPVSAAPWSALSLAL